MGSGDPWTDKWLHVEITTPKLKSVCVRVKRWCSRCYANERGMRGLVICGPAGCGKTHLASRALRFMRLAGVHAMHDRSTGWGQGGPDDFPATHSVSWDEIALEGPENPAWRDVVESAVVLIDDIGAEVDRYKTGAPTSNLRNLIERRIGKWTVFTTNIMPSEWHERWDSRVADRLLRDSEVIQMDGVESFAFFRLRNQKDEQ